MMSFLILVTRSLSFATEHTCVFLFRTLATGLSPRVENREKQHTQQSGSAKRLFDTGHTFIGFRHGAHVVFLFRTLATGLSRRVENREKQHTQRGVDLQNGFLILVTRSLGFATERTSSFFFERLQRVCRVEWKIERNSTRNEEWICKNGFLILVTRSLGFATERTSSFFFERLQRVCRVEWKIERNSTRNEEWICKTAF